MEKLLDLDLWKSTPWLQQIASLFTIIAIPYAFFRYVFYKTKLKISFQPKETYHEVILISHPKQPQSFWLQLMIKNNGFEVAKKSEAYLSQIWRKEQKNNYKKLEEFRAPVKLKWAHEAQIFPIDILPKSIRRLDVCYICQGEQILYLMTEGFAGGTIKNQISYGSYVFEIIALSENGIKPSRFLFEVTWDGQWRTLLGDSYVKSFKLARYPTKSFRRY